MVLLFSWLECWRVEGKRENEGRRRRRVLFPFYWLFPFVMSLLLNRLWRGSLSSHIDNTNRDFSVLLLNMFLSLLLTPRFPTTWEKNGTKRKAIKWAHSDEVCNTSSNEDNKHTRQRSVDFLSTEIEDSSWLVMSHEEDETSRLIDNRNEELVQIGTTETSHRLQLNCWREGKRADGNGRLFRKERRDHYYLRGESQER